ncbi:LysR substrate-binding domain-containing protein [Acidobacterium sp.]|uniref:LysR substrate-binding domain-containing protein n=1 Tax=Acidobacterium TaxID=33973 RepID=UPI0009FF9764|nr:hypothetical protein [Acidobacterium sp.]
MSSAVSTALRGNRFAVVSRWMFWPELADGRVISVLPEWTLPPMDLWLSIRRGSLPPQRLEPLSAGLRK